MMVRWLLLAVGLTLGACRTAPPPDAAPVPARYEALALERFGRTTTVTYLPNAAGTFVLVRNSEKPAPAQHPPVVSFFVYEPAADRVAYAEEALPGTVVWHGPHHLKVSRRTDALPGETADTPLTAVYYVDVRTGQRSETPPFEDA